MSSSAQDLSSTEKSQKDSALPSTDASEIQLNQYNEEPVNDNKARFLELRDGLTGWKWTLFHLIVFFGAAISGMKFLLDYEWQFPYVKSSYATH